jgi:AraC-like DNA-binding protein
MSDVLSDIFDTIRLRATIYFRTDYSPPWAISVPAFSQAARFHLVVQGRCHVCLVSGKALDLGPGDLIVIPRGQPHTLADSQGRSPAPLEQVVAQSGYDGRGAFVLGSGNPNASTQMVCGHLGFTEGADHPLLRALPEVIVMTTADRARHVLLDEVLGLLVRRVFIEGLGATSAIARLSEIFFIETIRAACEKHPELARVIGAMSDVHIGKGLDLMHAAPGKPWSVESLAAAVGMSRSRFAERFSELMGDGPMGYLADWRLQRALVLLSKPRTNVQEVAHAVGYQSAAAFTRAFSQKFGAPPSDYRPDSA